MNLCIFEDEKFRQLFPLTLLRPVALLRAGIFNQTERIRRLFGAEQTSVAVRDKLAGLVSQELRETPVNIIKHHGEKLLLINARLRDPGDLPEQVSKATHATYYVCQDDVAAVLLDADTLKGVPEVVTPAALNEVINDRLSEFVDAHTTATLHQYAWSFVADIDSAIASEFGAAIADLGKGTGRVLTGAWLVRPEQIYLAEGVEVMPGAVIDATAGPVLISANTKVESLATIYGPTYIGPNSVVVAGKIAGSSIGHTCRVGGEVEESIFQSYVNKYHAGFIGHSYVGSWVNFGAMTTNSDLKNNYSNIRVSVNGQMHDTGSIKVGSFIGDHTKFGIGTLLNTGINIGVCCNIFGGSLIADKEIPSFQWGNTGNYQEYRLDKALETVRRTCQRRNVELSEPEEKLLQMISEEKISDEGVVRFNF